MTNICKCGCGKIVKKGNKFINGHNRRGKPGFWIGKYRTGDTKKKISKALVGKHHSEKTKRKIGDSQIGEKHPNWKGGISPNPYPLEYRRIRESIRIRDDYTCQLCSRIGQQKNGKKLDVHHIDYNIKNSNPKNLITLCHICNREVSTIDEREVWIRIFQRRIKNKYREGVYRRRR